MLEPDSTQEVLDLKPIADALVKLPDRRHGFIVRRRDLVRYSSEKQGFVLRIPIDFNDGTWVFSDSETGYIELRVTSYTATLLANVAHKSIGIVRLPTANFKAVTLYKAWHAWNQALAAVVQLCHAKRHLNVYLHDGVEVSEGPTLLEALGLSNA